jgi:hypothetical protein
MIDLHPNHVMPGLVPGIHALLGKKDVDDRDIGVLERRSSNG